MKMTNEMIRELDIIRNKHYTNREIMGVLDGIITTGDCEKINNAIKAFNTSYLTISQIRKILISIRANNNKSYNKLFTDILNKPYDNDLEKIKNIVNNDNILYNRIKDRHRIYEAVTAHNTFVEKILSSQKAMQIESILTGLCEEEDRLLYNIIPFKFGGKEILYENITSFYLDMPSYDFAKNTFVMEGSAIFADLSYPKMYSNDRLKKLANQTSNLIDNISSQSYLYEVSENGEQRYEDSKLFISVDELVGSIKRTTFDLEKVMDDFLDQYFLLLRAFSVEKEIYSVNLDDIN